MQLTLVDHVESAVFFWYKKKILLGLPIKSLLLVILSPSCSYMNIMTCILLICHYYFRNETFMA